MPKQIPEDQVQAAIGQLDRVRSNWLRRPGVTAVDVGYKIKEEEITDVLAIRVHVERKIPTAALAEHEMFNVSGREAMEHAGFPIDVIEATYAPSSPATATARTRKRQSARAVETAPAPALTGAPFSLEEAPEAIDRRGRVDPLIGGISCGNPRITAGTLGAIVYDRTDGSAQILSNWHVLAGSSSAASGEAIWQPGRVDGGTSSDTIANLNRFRLDQDMDAGIAKLSGARAHTRDLIGLSPIPGTDSPRLGMKVRKSGRTTELTEGLIDGVSLSVNLNYGGSTGVNSFHDQIHIIPRPPWPSVDYELSRGGDSGSVWVNEANGRAVGLHFAGETNPAPTAEHAIANQMVKVAAPSGLNISFTPVFAPKPPVARPIPRAILRAILCQRFPWLCGRASSFFFPFSGRFGFPQGALRSPTVHPEQPAAAPWDGNGDAFGEDEGVIDAIIDTLYEEMGW